MNINDLTAVVLAGGRGTRIAGIYPTLPKPMTPTAGQPFLYWVTAWLVAQGINDIVYSIGHQADAIAHWVDGLAAAGTVALRYQVETRPLGTGGALLMAKALCRPIILVLNGDTLVPTKLAPALDRMAAENLDGIVLARQVADAARFGSLEVSDGLLKGFHEKRSGAGLVYLGIMAVRQAALLDYAVGASLSLETQLLPALLSAGVRIGVGVIAEPFLDIGTPDSVRLGARFVAGNRSSFSYSWR